MIRTRIFRKYGHTERCLDSRHATCTLGDRTRIRSDSDFFRGMEIQISGHVIDTRCVKVMIFIYSSRFAENTDVPHTSLVDRLTHLTRYDPSCNRNCTIRNATLDSPKRNSTIRHVSCVKFHGTLSFNVNFDG